MLLSGILSLGLNNPVSHSKPTPGEDGRTSQILESVKEPLQPETKCESLPWFHTRG